MLHEGQLSVGLEWVRWYIEKYRVVLYLILKHKQMVSFGSSRPLYLYLRYIYLRPLFKCIVMTKVLPRL